MSGLVRWVVVLLCTCAALPALAHEVRPGFLQLVEADRGLFDVLWKVPARGELALAIRPVISGGCRQVTTPVMRVSDDARVARWRIDCGTHGLRDAEVRIEGLDATMVDVLVRVEWAEGGVTSRILRPAEPAFRLAPGENETPVWGYLRLGVEHILLGVDHLLFVLGLLLIVRGPWRLVKTITAFTVAHSITLGLATLGFVHVAQAPVEAVIALSIVFVASELVRGSQGAHTLTARSPWVVAFAFGLLHGFGFAGALAEVGLPQTDIPLALLLFNVGVELGQLAFVAAVLTAARAIHRGVGEVPRWWPRAAAYGIGTVAAFWVIERVAVLLPGA